MFLVIDRVTYRAETSLHGYSHGKENFHEDLQLNTKADLELNAIKLQRERAAQPADEDCKTISPEQPNDGAAHSESKTDEEASMDM